jgi:hypothetical protein
MLFAALIGRRCSLILTVCHISIASSRRLFDGDQREFDHQERDKDLSNILIPHRSDLGIPHMVSQDDWYEGMFIPKGSMIWVGIWAMHQNEELYPEPERFNPDRFVNHTKLANEYAVGGDWENRDHYGYGAGRRLCPGVHLAERSMWRITAKLLWAFEFSEPIDPVTGKVQPLDENAYTSSNLVCPLPYRVSIKPRSDEHLAVIRRDLGAALDFLKPYE